MTQYAFTTAQIAEMTDLSMRQLDYWSQKEIFVPAVRQAHGSGTRKLYSLDDVIQLRSLRKLICCRWSTQKLRQAISMLREVMRDPNPLRYASLIADKHTLLAVYKTKEGERVLLDALCAGGQHVMSLVIEVVEEETRQLLFNFSEQGKYHEQHAGKNTVESSAGGTAGNRLCRGTTRAGIFIP